LGRHNEELAQAADTSNSETDCRLLDGKVRFFGDNLAMVYGNETASKGTDSRPRRGASPGLIPGSSVTAGGRSSPRKMYSSQANSGVFHAGHKKSDTGSLRIRSRLALPSPTRTNKLVATLRTRSRNWMKQKD